MKLVGFLDDGEPRRNGNGHVHVPVIGALGDLHRIVAEERIDRVIVAFSNARHNDFLRVVRACDDSGVRVNIVPRLFEVVSSRAVVDDVEGIPLLDVAHVELSRVNMAVKRVFDLVVGGVLCVVILPLIAVLGLAHQAGLPRPRVLPPGAHGARRQALPHLQAALDARRRRPGALGPRRPERLRRPDVQDARGSAHHAPRRRGCAAGASTSCRRSST